MSRAGMLGEASSVRYATRPPRLLLGNLKPAKTNVETGEWMRFGPIRLRQEHGFQFGQALRMNDELLRGRRCCIRGDGSVQPVAVDAVKRERPRGDQAQNIRNVADAEDVEKRRCFREHVGWDRGIERRAMDGFAERGGIGRDHGGGSVAGEDNAAGGCVCP